MLVLDCSALHRRCRACRDRSVGGSAQRKGGTLRIGRNVRHRLRRPGACVLGRPRGDRVRHLRQALTTTPTESVPAGAIAIPEVGDSLHHLRLERTGRLQTIRLEADVTASTRARPITAANFVAAFNRDRQPEAGVAGADLPARDRRRGRRHRGQGDDDLGRPRAQPVHARDPARRSRSPTSAARLTMPFFCPIAANTPPPGDQQPAGSGPYYVASRFRNRQVVLERNRFYRGPRPANIDQVVWTITGSGEPAGVAVERNELDYCAAARSPVLAAYRELAAEYGINTTDKRFFFNRDAHDGVLRLQPRSPRVPGRRPDPAQAGDQLGDRPAQRSCEQHGYRRREADRSDAAARRWVATRASTHSET